MFFVISICPCSLLPFLFVVLCSVCVFSLLYLFVFVFGAVVLVLCSCSVLLYVVFGRVRYFVLVIVRLLVLCS